MPVGGPQACAAPLLRVLCLHGYMQSARIMYERLGPLRRALKGTAELVFVDGPHAAVAPPAGFRPSAEHDASAATSRMAPKTIATTPAPPPLPAAVAVAGTVAAPPSAGAAAVPPVAHAAPLDAADADAAQQTPSAALAEVADALSPPQWRDGVGRAWVLSQREDGPCEGLAESVQYLWRVFAEQGPFDGVLGFSQGAMMAAFLCTLRDGSVAMLSDGTLVARNRDAALPATPISFRFAMFFCGFLPRYRPLRELFSHRMACPSLHVYGTADAWVRNEWSELLAAQFSDPIIVTHPGGHCIPTTAEKRRAFADFVRGFAVRARDRRSAAARGSASPPAGRTRHEAVGGAARVAAR